MIPREQIKSLKTSLSVPEYFRLTNHFVKRAGKDYVIHCPFHKDKRASCFLYEDHFHCYGCLERGDVIEAHMRLKKTDFLTALAELSRMAGLNQYQPERIPGRSGRFKPTRNKKE